MAPVGRGDPADGGIRLSGKFGWSSGCDHAAFAILGYLGKNALGQPGPCFALVPAKDFRIVDDWHSAALAGSGSKSIVVEEAFVPAHRCESLFALGTGTSQGYGSHSGRLYTLPFSPVFSLGFSAVAVGIARRFASLFTEKSKARRRSYTGARASDDASAQMRLAESVHQTAAAHELLRADWRAMSAQADRRKLPSSADVLRWRGHQAYGTKMAIEAVNRMMAGAGGSAWLLDNEMQRLFRDVQITGAHAQTEYGMASQTVGRALLELLPDSTFF